ncbi:MAG UNVERIFIED_CONTAM: hypothetical protein LVR18_35845 [Planctomycetaceae bacterium]
MQSGEYGIAELTTVTVSDGSISGEAFARAEISGSPLKEQTKPTGGLFDGFPHGTNPVGADKRIVPCERCGVTGVVDEHSEGLAGVVGKAGDEECVVGLACGVESTDSVSAFGVEKVAMTSETAATGADDSGSGAQVCSGFCGSAGDRLPQLKEVGFDEIVRREIRCGTVPSSRNRGCA